ncbi:DUF4269 domain-containing protein [Pontibacter sp. G13]|uniref:DUF4269 domain-containing protein n=1 Tax=Pontibacter sp. G13 TaxID=3074898 RepID=UPI00288A3025|nr:DUF4269 domain-containing protein [Pontibacter sp. G13]WNJ17749.1 DUF4269 domain-containing protein [Pontibacter sp. G13]
MTPNFMDIEYLKVGSSRQKQAYDLLKQLAVMDTLAPYDPLLAGTIPIEIDLPESDLDIICQVRDHEAFSAVLAHGFGEQEAFEVSSYPKLGQWRTVARFRSGGFEVEIFGQDEPTISQYAFKHMLIEWRLLQKHGEAFRQKILALKRSGMKTEPAFAQVLGLSGDPYQALLDLGNSLD